MPGLPFRNLPAVTNDQSYIPQQGPFAGLNFKDFMINSQPQQFTGGTMPQQFTGGAVSQQLDPFAIVDQQFQSAQKQLFNYFDQARYALDQQNLDPKQYLREVDNLHDNIRREEFALKTKAEAQVESMGQIVKLMQQKRLDPKIGQRALYKLAGVSDEVADSMFPDEPKPVDPMALHARLVAEDNRLTGIVDKFSPGTGKWRGGDPTKLYYNKLDKKGYPIPDTPDKDEEATDDDFRFWSAAVDAQQTIRQQEQQVLDQMSPLQGTAIAMSTVAMKKRRGMWQTPPSPSWFSGFRGVTGMSKLPTKGGIQGFGVRLGESIKPVESISNKIRVQAPDGREGTMDEAEWRQKRIDLEAEGWSLL